VATAREHALARQEADRRVEELRPLARKYRQSMMTISSAYFALGFPLEDVPTGLREVMVRGRVSFDRVEELIDDLCAVRRRLGGR
jgi:hypothetical protein